jgi:hypoxanthine-guanine phosphoribosyltransferase
LAGAKFVISVATGCAMSTSIPLPDDCDSILITKEEIESRIDILAKEISEHYASLLNGEPLILVPILSGSYIFAGNCTIA